jgi:NAD(P)-dependent dehydrogenase (short-subunit alcohol dehydrogenase family)
MEKLPDLFDLTGRVAVVTGGAGLLGGEFCRTLMEAGANTVIADLDERAANDTAASLNESQLKKRDRSKDTSQRALGIKTDISSKDSVQQMVAKTLSEFHQLDILVNNAALDPKFNHQRETKLEEIEPASNLIDPLSFNFEHFPIELWNQALDVNLTGMFLCCQAAGKQMLVQGRGVIINMSSIYGLVGPDQRIYQKQGQPSQYKPAYYSVTKAGVIGLTSYLATYYAGKGIRVNALTPGGVYNGHDDAFLDAYSARSVMGRMAEKNEMNGALLFLASDASSYMTGGNLVVDGGWTAW